MDQFTPSGIPPASRSAAVAPGGALSSLPGGHSSVLPSSSFDLNNDFPSLGGQPSNSLAAAHAAAVAHRASVGADGTAVAGGPAGVGTVGTASLSGPGARASSSFNTSAQILPSPADAPPHQMGDFTELYHLSNYASRGKAVEVLTGSAASEFSMQNEDFPALGAMGAKTPGTLFGINSISNLTSALPPSVSQQSLAQQFQSQQLHHRPQSPQHHQHQEQSKHAVLRNGELNRVSDLPGSGQTPNGTSGACPKLSSSQTQFQDLRNLETQNRGFRPPPLSQQQQLPRSSQLKQESQQKQWSPGSDVPSPAHSLFDTAVPSSPQSKSESHPAAVQTHPKPQPRSSPPLSESQPTADAEDSTSEKAQSHENCTDELTADPEVGVYGMKGLVRVLNPGSHTTDLFTISVGMDLTKLGLNLNSPDPLNVTFDQPWEEESTGEEGSKVKTSRRPGEPEYKLPECYFMHPPPIKTSHFLKFQLETLFYVFYNMPGNVLQLLAAVELNNRDWRYHKELKFWFTRAPGTTPEYERGAAYIYFDISRWERRPFHDANHKFAQGLLSEDELRTIRIPAHLNSM